MPRELDEIPESSEEVEHYLTGRFPKGTFGKPLERHSNIDPEYLGRLPFVRARKSALDRYHGDFCFYPKRSVGSYTDDEIEEILQDAGMR